MLTCLYTFVYIYVKCACLLVCICVFLLLSMIFIYLFIHVCVCVCKFMYVAFSHVLIVLYTWYSNTSFLLWFSSLETLYLFSSLCSKHIFLLDSLFLFYFLAERYYSSHQFLRKRLIWYLQPEFLVYLNRKCWQERYQEHIVLQQEVLWDSFVSNLGCFSPNNHR